MQQVFECRVLFAPGDDSVSERVRSGREGDSVIQTQLLSCPGESGKRMVAMAAGVGRGERVEFAFRNLKHSPDLRKKTFQPLACGSRKTALERDCRQPTPRAGDRAWHGATPANGRPKSRLQLRHWYARSETASNQSTLAFSQNPVQERCFSHTFKNSRYVARPDRDDKHACLCNRAP